ncbi:N-formylglutamate amidohydrolase [Nocardioides sp. Soil805]|uniref:N-formylglutamate amidohydrolase n=1 Tax=Nocardioides sp. Soil805 TaxID=1736416 RepID=UPI00070299B2|nr:N-formylglutamate amidohydrolase [Nocardioides sp. Soil805]KRF37476.1 N-formylglutamate amidohydrolase [Nocardioides sp. Soil805]
MTTGRGTSGIVAFTGGWDTQVVATSVHAGHDLRPRVAEAMVLGEDVRLREEDPYTDVIATAVESRALTFRSRFEVDLNRPREEAVYRKPEDCWGLDVWADGTLSEELTTGSLEVYDEFYRRLGEQLDEVAARGPFVLLDVHSYNHRRDGVDAEPEPAEDNPDVNVGTGTLDRERFGGLVDDFMTALSAEQVGGEPLDVRENVRFQGRAVSWFVHDRYPDVGCCLALEFKKTFMDEWTREVDHEGLAETVRALGATVPVLERALARLR